LGSIYKRGNIYWIKYYRNSKPYRESSESKKEADAKRLLKKREGEISSGKLPGIYFDKVLFDELAEDLITDYLINGQSVKEVRKRLNHLMPQFEGVRVVVITSPQIKSYIEMRIDEGAANATINRELAALKRMLNLAAQQTPPKVDRVPYIPMLKENNVRKGFFEHNQFLALRSALPFFLQPFVTFAYKVGWRDTEISSLKWNQVDLDQGIVRLEVGETKNDEGRTVYLDKELKELFTGLWESRKRSRKLTPYVFANEAGNGPIKDFRGAWNRACRETELGYGYRFSKKYVAKWQDKLPSGPILHDFRRTAVRNMVRAGIPERVAMMVSGHKTRSVFDRYNIVNEISCAETGDLSAGTNGHKYGHSP
jgi:integrase